MVVARFKDLCMDATDAAKQGRFWSSVLKADLVDLGDGGVRVDRRKGEPGHESIWIDPVPEPRQGKTRVHLDLRLPAADPSPLVAVGATIHRQPDDEIHWWVLADPDGNEFCAFPPRADDARSTTTVYELVVDCADPLAQAAWWARITGGTVEADEGGTAVVGAAGFPWEYWVFDPVPEPKTVKNRMHWDVDLVAPDPSGLVAAGATMLRVPDDRISWWVLADPEGNEFCAFAPKDTLVR